MRRTMIGLLYKDIVNYFKFRKVIKQAKQETNSTYNQYALKHNKTYTSIGCILTLPSECATLDETNKSYFIIDKLSPLIKYLDTELQFSEYLVLNEPDPFMEIDDNGNIKETLSYLIEFNFEFKKLSWGLFIKLILLTNIAYYAYTIYA